MLQAVHGWSSTYERFVKSQKFFSSYLTQEDLSRFGRNYIEVGSYSEIIYPEAGVRFIAIMDNVDTGSLESNEFAAFTNLFNEWYPKSTSKKVKEVKKAKGLAGEHLGCAALWIFTESR